MQAGIVRAGWLFALAAAMASWPTPGMAGEDPIRRLLADQVAGWNAADAEAWGEHLAEDADFINILGMHFRGRQAAVQRHAELFDTAFKGSRLGMDVDRIRHLGRSAAVAETTLRLSGYRRLPPGIHPTTGDGTLRTRMTYVFAHEGGRWRIVLAQNTAIMRRDPGID